MKLYRMYNNYDCQTYMCEKCVKSYSKRIDEVDEYNYLPGEEVMFDDNATWCVGEEAEPGKDYGWGMIAPEKCLKCGHDFKAKEDMTNDKVGDDGGYPEDYYNPDSICNECGIEHQHCVYHLVPALLTMTNALPCPLSL